MQVVTIPAVEIINGMKIRSFSAPDTYYTVEATRETESGGCEFTLRYSKDMKVSRVFFAADENAKILVGDDELAPLITCFHIECMFCGCGFPTSKIDVNNDIFSECPDCEREVRVSKCKVVTL